MNWLRGAIRNSNSQPMAVVERHTTLADPYVIVSPKLGILNLLGKPGESLVNEDKLGLSTIFASSAEATGSPPICDVLFLYCHIDKSGSLIGSKDTLRQIMFASRAPIVVVASSNPPDAYIAASKRPGHGHANLVMVLDREGTNFVVFFQRPFNLMKQGKTMPVAWVELAPQLLPGGMSHPDAPESIFACESGHILFR